MPTYEYRCTECGQHIEVVQSFTDEPLTVCGACQGALRKVFSPIGITFKGSGFYRTDSRSSGTAKSERTADTKSDTKTESKSESKSEATSSSSDSGSKSEAKSA